MSGPWEDYQTKAEESGPWADYGGVSADTEKPKPEKSVGGFLSNLGSDVVNTAKGLGEVIMRGPVNLAGDIGKLVLGGSEAAQRELGMIDYPQSPEEMAARGLVKPITESINNPAGIPGRIVDYAYEKPFSTAMNVSTGLGVAGAGAKALGGVRTANALAKASELTNPISMASKTVTAPLNAISNSKIPEEIYARTMKMPPGSLKVKSRGEVLKTMVREEKLPLNQKSIDFMDQTIKSLDEGITTAIETATQQGGKIDINKVADTLDDLKKKYSNRPNPNPYYEAIDSAKDDFLNHAFVNNGEVSLLDAHKLKKGTYAEIQAYYKKQQKPETGRVGIQNDVDSAAKAEAARVLRQEVLENSLIPEAVKADMKRESGLMNARKWVERATNRGGNIDPVSMAGMVFGILVNHGVAGPVAWHIAKSQSVLSRLAINLAKTRSPIGPTVPNAPFQVAQVGEESKSPKMTEGAIPSQPESSKVVPPVSDQRVSPKETDLYNDLVANGHSEESAKTYIQKAKSMGKL